ncbi:MAG TPA: peptidylprolyl isomerase [Byssovorax sp.]|jgi:peptidyl-prolyl cis-trans isomerase A (cyclophilin A)
MKSVALSIPLVLFAVACGGSDAPAEPTAKPEAKTAAPPPSAAPSAAASAAPSAAHSAEASAAPSGSAKADAPKGEEGAKAASNKGPFPESKNPDLKDPKKQKGEAPKEFKVKFETSAGDFDVKCVRDWAPHGVDRFYHLVKIGFFDDVSFFRVVKTPKPFVVQFGIHGNPDVAKEWANANIPVDPVKGSNKRGFLTYAMAGSPTTRSTQMFINLGDNEMLDKMGFAPVCEVVGDGMKVVDALEGKYGELASKHQEEIQKEGNKFLRAKFDGLDYIKTVKLDDGKPEKAEKHEKAAKH